MTTPPNDPDPLQRVGWLGATTERLFSRLYSGLRRPTAPAEALAALAARYDAAQAQLAQREAELDQLHGALAVLPDGVLLQDLDGRVVFMNDAARGLLGSAKAARTTELAALFDTFRDVDALPSELTPLGAPRRFELNHRVLGAQLAAVADGQGKRIGTLILLRDATRETLAERLQEQFVASLTHELRTPMAVIKMSSELMLNAPGDQAPNRKLLGALTRNVDVLDRMIVELLDISEIGAGTFTVRHEPVEVEALVWQVINGVTPEVKRAKLDVAVMTRNAQHLTLMGDAPRLRWALGHLVQNAIRYTEPGGHIVLTLAADDAMQVVLQVGDTGVGISPRDLPRIFERFYRGEARTHDGRLLDPRGLGQGLYVARTVAEAHGGYLSAHSTPGAGSVFTMVLPARPHQGREVAPPLSPPLE